MSRPACKHSRGVERYFAENGHRVLWCYSCGKDINVTLHEDCEGACKSSNDNEDSGSYFDNFVDGKGT